ncbi:MAG: histidine-type phosphatase, partial [Actinomycetales bacterium]
PVGEAELRGIGARVGLRLPGLLGPGTRAEIWSSGVQRASDSAEAFRSGLAAGAPSTTVGEVEADPRLLRFDKTDPEYARFIADDVAATQAVRRVAESAPVQAASRHVLERVFTPAYVSTLDDPAAAALSLWNLYAIVPGMGGATSADFSAFVSHSDAVALGTLHDADYFYRRGPSFSGQDDTYRAARVLLDDFFAAVHRRLKGGATAGVFRFAHAEQLIPFSALVGLPGSTQQVTPGRPYSAADNPWRGGLVSPLGGNVQWDVFRDDRGRVLVRVLQNERQVPVAERCRPAPGTRLYYRLTELRRCLR